MTIDWCGANSWSRQELLGYVLPTDHKEDVDVGPLNALTPYDFFTLLL